MVKTYTLARGGRSREFGYEERNGEVWFYTGKEFSTTFIVYSSSLSEITEHFKDKGWFILGNQVDAVKSGGLGDFCQTIGIPPKNASHLSAYMVMKGLLEYRDDYGLLEFKVKQ